MLRLCTGALAALLLVSSCGTPTPTEGDDSAVLTLAACWVNYKSAAEAGDKEAQAQALLTAAAELGGAEVLLADIVPSETAKAVALGLLSKDGATPDPATVELAAKILQIGIATDGLQAFLLLHPEYAQPPAEPAG